MSCNQRQACWQHHTASRGGLEQLLPSAGCHREDGSRGQTTGLSWGCPHPEALSTDKHFKKRGDWGSWRGDRDPAQSGFTFLLFSQLTGSLLGSQSAKGSGKADDWQQWEAQTRAAMEISGTFRLPLKAFPSTEQVIPASIHPRTIMEKRAFIVSKQEGNQQG